MLTGGRPEDHGPHLSGGDYRAGRLVGGPTIQHDRQSAGRQEYAASRPRNDPIRVVFCIDNMQIGGTELNAVRTAERLDRSRFEVSVVCLQEDGPLKGRYEAAGIEVVPLPLRSLASSDTLKQGLGLARLLKSRSVDILHAHDIYSNIFGVTFARAAGTRGVIASRRWWADRRTRRLRRANRLSCSLAHRVLANSPSLEQLLVDEGVPRRRIRVVPNFLDESAFAPIAHDSRTRLLRELGVPDGATVIGSVANLRPVKDHKSLLEAFSLLDQQPTAPVHLVLVGEGECRSLLEESAQKLGIEDRVHFAGRRVNNPNLHHLFDISVLNSLNEGCSNSILEAMAAGNPVVATNVGGNPDVVADGETGLLVPVSNPPELVGALERLLQDHALRTSMGQAGRATARSTFSAEAALSELAGIYHELTPAAI